MRTAEFARLSSGCSTTLQRAVLAHGQGCQDETWLVTTDILQRSAKRCKKTSYNTMQHVCNTLAALDGLALVPVGPRPQLQHLSQAAGWADSLS
jgi:hypothetical protein